MNTALVARRVARLGAACVAALAVCLVPLTAQAAGTATATTTATTTRTAAATATGGATSAGTPAATAASPSPAPAVDGAAAEALPMLAYYYIWFDPSSWERAKRDTPLVGRYSSDERAVMRRHVRLAKAAGIDGFIVSWKDTPKLTERLRRLVEIAREEDFKLAIVYQGLDFARQPIPVSKVASDLEYLANTYADDPVFHVVDDRPLVVWTGTDDFSDADLQSAVAPVRSRLMLLASSRSVEQYRRVAGFFEGSAYYWSSVNPTKSWYPRQLAEMGAAVHASGGLWVAPAAAGFDARLVGGKSVVERQGGRTLQLELETAVRSAADVIGLISWNEFTENSHVEPSTEYGDQELRVVAAFTGSDAPRAVVDSSVPARQASPLGGGLNGVAAFGVTIALLGGLLVWVRWRGAPATSADPGEPTARHVQEDE